MLNSGMARVKVLVLVLVLRILEKTCNILTSDFIVRSHKGDDGESDQEHDNQTRSHVCGLDCTELSGPRFLYLYQHLNRPICIQDGQRQCSNDM